jgi:hypothetical protein
VSDPIEFPVEHAENMEMLARQTDPNGWPDPQRPGVPMNPERDGAHAFDDHGVSLVLLWRMGWWIGPIGASSKPHELTARRVRYLGPCPPPAEVAARVAEARDLARIEVAADMRSQADGLGDAWHATMEMLAARLLNGDAMQALEARVAEARREGLREAAAWCDDAPKKCYAGRREAREKCTCGPGCVEACVWCDAGRDADIQAMCYSHALDAINAILARAEGKP